MHTGKYLLKMNRHGEFLVEGEFDDLDEAIDYGMINFIVNDWTIYLGKEEIYRHDSIVGINKLIDQQIQQEAIDCYLSMEDFLFDENLNESIRVNAVAEFVETMGAEERWEELSALIYAWDAAKNFDLTSTLLNCTVWANNHLNYARQDLLKRFAEAFPHVDTSSWDNH